MPMNSGQPLYSGQNGWSRVSAMKRSQLQCNHPCAKNKQSLQLVATDIVQTIENKVLKGHSVCLSTINGRKKENQSIASIVDRLVDSPVYECVNRTSGDIRVSE